MNPNVHRASFVMQYAPATETKLANALDAAGLLITPEERELVDAVRVDRGSVWSGMDSHFNTSWARVRRAARAVRAAGKPSSKGLTVEWIHSDEPPMTDYRVVCDPATPTPADVLAEAIDARCKKHKLYDVATPSSDPGINDVAAHLAAYRAWKKPAPRYYVRETFGPHLRWEVMDRVLGDEHAYARYRDKDRADQEVASLNEVKP